MPNQASVALFKIQTNKPIAARLTAAALVSVDLFVITICKPAAAPKLVVAQVNAALLEIPICKRLVGQALTTGVALQAAPLVNAVLFKTRTDKPTAGPQLAEVKANAALYVTTTCRQCVALKPAVAQANADLSETPI